MAFELITRLKFNKKTGYHSIAEAGFIYEFPESLYNDFRNYVLQYDFVSRWYKQLDEEKQHKVNRLNAYETR